MLSFAFARKGHMALYLSVCGVLLMVAAVSAVSARDADGVGLRAGMILLAAGASLLLPWQFVLPAVAVCWFGPNAARTLVSDYELFNTNMLLELPGMLGLGVFGILLRRSAELLESGAPAAVDESTGVYEARGLELALETELTRSRRFRRDFALVLVGVDTLHQRFDYRDAASWQESFKATARLLKGTRNNIDQVYRYGPSGFAMILPESGADEVTGMVKRLRRLAKNSKPREGEPGGPLPASFGATFYPTRATTIDDMLRRAEVALHLASKNSNRLQLDSAEAPALPPPETMRREIVLPAGAHTNGNAASSPAAPAVSLVPAATTDAKQEHAGEIDNLADMLLRMDETLELLRGLRSRDAS